MAFSREDIVNISQLALLGIPENTSSTGVVSKCGAESM
jgi:hypothetical protein